MTVPSISNAVTDEGISVITDSSLGTTVRRSAIQGARIIDNADEKWERFSDSLRDKSRCDENTGRRLFDNGFRKDGTRIGNPVLGNLCNPEPLLALDQKMADRVLNLAVQSAEAGNNNMSLLLKTISDTEELVRASFERSIQDSADEEERKRKTFNFALYSKMRAISNSVNSNPAQVKKFQLNWGKQMVSELAPFADRKNYASPFPVTKDEFEDYDYDKDRLLDSLGALQVSLEKLRSFGLIGHSEIVIPYDDYGSVITVAIDDYVPIGAEMLLSEQNYSIAGPASALIRSVMDKANINYSLDVFYLDPSTTKQSVYNPSQLLLSLSNLRKF
eukprot:CAMPEP_0197830670 /NCGR_PEP_ID=MMETSP1437-20131217/7287_1 /TAXON_ID=49252 ORGANISM="Eucampia antarctica, Strain CCMP1452" /NCGR_SAMPLE_ID=MMETSP1437 /ASSEMBLY_ACC=CAM_ASM_001096 /LENGTH=331 /DNA_ID=CAMNT_0043433215 /DNA_START=228 /DNA_END=1223 /DNA_ORIENTATION=-